MSKKMVVGHRMEEVYILTDGAAGRAEIDVRRLPAASRAGSKQGSEEEMKRKMMSRAAMQVGQLSLAQSTVGREIVNHIVGSWQPEV